MSVYSDNDTQLNIRIPKPLKEALEAQVEGMNNARNPGDPTYTLTGFILGVLWAIIEPKAPRHDENKRRKAVRK